MADIPNLPGFRSNAVPKKKVTQKFKYINGYAFENDKGDSGIKRELTDFATLQKNSPKRPQAGPSKLPSWLAHDRLVYKFNSYFLEAVSESNAESFRVRKVDILFYKSDGSIQVSEAKQENSGIPQGIFIKRHKIPCSDGSRQLGLDDIEVGDTVTMYGRKFMIVNCDDFTRNDLLASGYAVKDPLPYPADKFSETRKDFMQRETGADASVYRGARNNPMKEFMEATLGNESKNNRMLGQFLQKDGQVLCFDCYWEDTRVAGKLRFFKLHYFLSSDELEIVERFEPNSGFDKMPKLLQKNKLEKPVKGQYVGVRDLFIGAKLNVFKRTIVLTDADDFTRRWYQSNQKVYLGEKIIKERPVKILPRDKNPPSHDSSSFGTEADSRRSWESLHPKPPRKNLQQMMKFDGKVMYFKAKMTKDGPKDLAQNDMTRVFIFGYFLADDTVQIHEPAQRNSGHIGGKFLERGKHKNPDTGVFFALEDFVLNGKIRCCGRCFLIFETSAQNAAGGGSGMRPFSQANIKNIITKLENKLRRHGSSLARTFRMIDKDKSNTLTYDEMKEFLHAYFSADEMSDQEVFIVMRYFDTDGEGRIDYKEFAAKILGKDVGENSYTTTSSADGGDTMADSEFMIDPAEMVKYRQILIDAVESDRKKAFLAQSYAVFRKNANSLLSSSKLKNLFQVNDVGFNGTISYDRFEAILAQQDGGATNSGGFNLRMTKERASCITDDVWSKLGQSKEEPMTRKDYFKVFAFKEDA